MVDAGSVMWNRATPLGRELIMESKTLDMELCRKLDQGKPTCQSAHKTLSFSVPTFRQAGP